MCLNHNFLMIFFFKLLSDVGILSLSFYQIVDTTPSISYKKRSKNWLVLILFFVSCFLFSLTNTHIISFFKENYRMQISCVRQVQLEHISKLLARHGIIVMLLCGIHLVLNTFIYCIQNIRFNTYSAYVPV